MENTFIRSLKSYLKSLKIDFRNNIKKAKTIDQKRAIYREYRRDLNKIKSNPEIKARYREYKNDEDESRILTPNMTVKEEKKPISSSYIKQQGKKKPRNNIEFYKYLLNSRKNEVEKLNKITQEITNSVKTENLQKELSGISVIDISVSSDEEYTSESEQYHDIKITKTEMFKLEQFFNN